MGEVQVQFLLGAFPISVSKSIDERSNLPILTEYLMGLGFIRR